MDVSVPALLLECQRASRVIVTGTAGRRIVWKIWGEGRKLVLLHGDAGSWTHWVRNVLPLSCDLMVIAPDLPGYGDSDAPAEPWSPESLAGLLAGGLRELVQSDPYSLAGFSFGGIIAGHLAAADRGRIERLILLGPGGMALPGSADTRPLRRLRPGMDPAETMDVHRHNLAALMFADPARIDDLAVHVQARNVAQARLRAGGIPNSDSLLRALAHVAAPLHGIWGQHDVFAAPYVQARAAALRRFQPDASFRIIAGAGHWTPYECPDQVNGALKEIMARGPGAAASDGRP